jgi:chromosome segregation ATPase
MSYVSENDMKEFFQNVIDSVAQLSTQASRVEGLVEQVARLSERLNALEQENHSLRSQIADANNTVERMSSEMAHTHGQLDNERAVTQALRQTIIERDAGVQSLEQSFRNEQDTHKITTSERDDARQKANELENEVQRLKQSYNDLSTDRDTWRSLATDHEREVNQLKRQLEQINSVLNPLRVVSSDVA